MRAEAPNGLPRALGLTLTVTFLPPRAWHHAASSTLVPPLRPRGTAGAPEARTPSPGLRPDGPRPRALELPPLRGGRARDIYSLGDGR
ncbi:transmembrane protein 250 isoform X2 [Sarcophilus harrisii]|uniref:transmembrane protein 250 isoform X2 n=1 Tax=Sarcophilus harrisii TaxID=9305 RepID=UPI0013019EC0|nr:transmembrane protein 250 isoform X2 [Sarcophilus harrisii]